MQLEVTAAASRERLLLRTGHASTKKNDACVPLGTTGPRVGSWSIHSLPSLSLEPSVEFVCFGDLVACLISGKGKKMYLPHLLHSSDEAQIFFLKKMNYKRH